MLNNFARVNKLLYRSSGPSPSDIKLFKGIGIRKIVSLDKDVGNKIQRATKLLNIEHIILPIEIGNRKSLLKFLHKDLFNLLQANGPVLVHCSAGKDRTGLACALFRVRYQLWPASAAIKEARSFGFGIGIDPSVIKLYIKLIYDGEKKSSDINDADIVANEREAASNYDDYESGNREQTSWSPFADYRVREYPFSPVDAGRLYQEQYDTRETRGLSDAPENKEYDDNVIPQSGQYSSITSLIGAGPSMIGSGYID